VPISEVLYEKKKLLHKSHWKHPNLKTLNLLSGWVNNRQRKGIREKGRDSSEKKEKETKEVKKGRKEERKKGRKEWRKNK
jgi:hypothetical protein